MFASILDKKKNSHIRRMAEIVLGLYLFAYTYLINNTREVGDCRLLHSLNHSLV